MKNKINYLLMFLVFNSSCFILFPKPKSLEKRLKVYDSEIQRSDTSKISFKGVYIASYNYPTNSNDYRYDCYKFFPNGKVLNSRGSYRKKLTKEETEDFSKGIWRAYYIKGNNIYIDIFNAYNGYYLRRGYFSKDYKEILFTDEINSIGKVQDKVTNIYVLEFFDD